jgi:hypothetical protein
MVLAQLVIGLIGIFSSDFAPASTASIDAPAPQLCFFAAGGMLRYVYIGLSLSFGKRILSQVSHRLDC